MQQHTKTFVTALAAVTFGATLATAASAAVPGQSQINGTITAITGKYTLHVQTRQGEIDDVVLHPGTIINPTGLTLRNGMHVTILGNATGGSFAANEIDTPYHVENGYGPQYAYGPTFGYGFGYGGYPGFGYPSFGNTFYPGSVGFGRVYVPNDRHNERSEAK